MNWLILIFNKMKIVKQSESSIFDNSDICQAVIYSLGDKDIDISLVKVGGRHPSQGYVVNEICKEVSYIIDGSGLLNIENTEYSFNKGDVILIEPGEKYFWNGNFEALMSCTPAWYPEQHKMLD